MISHYPYEQLGSANYGWLKAKYHFSFANYYNPERMGFGTLRVINDDVIDADRGFPPHPHSNMEIISIIKSGAISHQDSEGNHGEIKQGEIQVMSAGSGITHSEYNRGDEPLTLYQIWIEPNKIGVTPRWDSKKFSLSPASNLPLLVSGYAEDKNEALFINQAARLFGGRVIKGAHFTHNITHQAYVLASSGMFTVSDEKQEVILNKGDGAEVSKPLSRSKNRQDTITIKALTDCEIFIIDAPASPS